MYAANITVRNIHLHVPKHLSLSLSLESPLCGWTMWRAEYLRMRINPGKVGVLLGGVPAGVSWLLRACCWC